MAELTREVGRPAVQATAEHQSDRDPRPHVEIDELAELPAGAVEHLANRGRLDIVGDAHGQAEPFGHSGTHR